MASLPAGFSKKPDGDQRGQSLEARLEGLRHGWADINKPKDVHQNVLTYAADALAVYEKLHPEALAVYEKRLADVAAREKLKLMNDANPNEMERQQNETFRELLRGMENADGSEYEGVLVTRMKGANIVCQLEQRDADGSFSIRVRRRTWDEKNEAFVEDLDEVEESDVEGQDDESAVSAEDSAPAAEDEEEGEDAPGAAESEEEVDEIEPYDEDPNAWE